MESFKEEVFVMIDYEKLLEKYMASIMAIEGTDFLNSVYLEQGTFADTEMKVLGEMSDNIRLWT